MTSNYINANQLAILKIGFNDDAYIAIEANLLNMEP